MNTSNIDALSSDPSDPRHARPGLGMYSIAHAAMGAPAARRHRCSGAAWLALGLTLVLGAGNATAAAVVDQTSVTGYISVGAGTWNTGPSPGYGINLHSDEPSTPGGGSYVTPATPKGYDFAAPGNAHSLTAAIPDWEPASVKLQAELAPKGSGANGLAINHLHFDLWVGDTLGYGKSAGGSFNTATRFSKSLPNGVYSALHWEVQAFPDSPGAFSNTKIGMDLRLFEQATLLSMPLTNASGDYAKGYPGMYAGSDAFDGYFTGIVGSDNGGCSTCPSPGGRFLLDVWWAFSDAPIDPTTLAQRADPLLVPEPQTWTLVMGGLAIVGALGPRRRRAAQSSTSRSSRASSALLPRPSLS